MQTQSHKSACVVSNVEDRNEIKRENDRSHSALSWQWSQETKIALKGMGGGGREWEEVEMIYHNPGHTSLL